MCTVLLPRDDNPIAVKKYILIVVYVLLDAATLTEVFPCSFLSYKANARV